MKRTFQLSALLAGAALFSILPVSNLSAQSKDVALTSKAHTKAQVQQHLDYGDELVAEGRYGTARREYRAAAELMRAEDKLPSQPLRRIANSYYYEDRYQTAGKVLLDLADEAAKFGELKCEVWALADAAWVAGIAGDGIDMEKRLARLDRLLSSPYLPDIAKEELRNKRLTYINAGQRLAAIPEVP
jgi:hypothetical protein